MNVGHHPAYRVFSWRGREHCLGWSQVHSLRNWLWNWGVIHPYLLLFSKRVRHSILFSGWGTGFSKFQKFKFSEPWKLRQRSAMPAFGWKDLDWFACFGLAMNDELPLHSTLSVIGVSPMLLYFANELSWRRKPCKTGIAWHGVTSTPAADCKGGSPKRHWSGGWNEWSGDEPYHTGISDSCLPQLWLWLKFLKLSIDEIVLVVCGLWSVLIFV